MLRFVCRGGHSGVTISKSVLRSFAGRPGLKTLPGGGFEDEIEEAGVDEYIHDSMKTSYCSFTKTNIDGG